MQIDEAIETLASHLRTNPKYREAWKSNIACHAMDEGLEPDAATRAADSFLRTLCEGAEVVAADKEQDDFKFEVGEAAGSWWYR